MSIAMAMYTEEGSQSKTPPAPNVCGLITAGDLMTREKTPFVIDLVENALVQLQLEWRPLIANHKGHEPHATKSLIKALQMSSRRR